MLLCNVEEEMSEIMSSSIVRKHTSCGNWFLLYLMYIGYALFSERVALELVWLLCWQEKKKGLEGCSAMPILDHLEVKE